MIAAPRRGVPDPGGVSGTFAALERTTPIVQVAAEGIPTTTSMRVANGTHVQHQNVRELIQDNLADFEEFGPVRFETGEPAERGGRPVKVAILNEEHATLLLTYMRNSEIVRDFKKRLVREFSALRRGVTPQTREERLALAVIDAQQMLVEKDERIAELEPKAELADNYLTAQGGARLVRQVAKTLGIPEKELRRFLLDEGLIYTRHSKCGDVQYDHYAQFAHHFLPRETVVQHQWGSCSHYTLYILPRGVELISKRLRARQAAS